MALPPGRLQTARSLSRYTGMLRAVLNISWMKHPTKMQLCGNLPQVSLIIRKRRLSFAGHCWRNKEELASDALLWHPKHGVASVRYPARTYIDQLADNTSLCLPEELPAVMRDRSGWKERVRSFQDINST